MSEQELSRQKEMFRALTVDREEMQEALEEAHTAEGRRSRCSCRR